MLFLLQKSDLLLSTATLDCSRAHLKHFFLLKLEGPHLQLGLIKQLRGSKIFELSADGSSWSPKELYHHYLPEGTNRFVPIEESFGKESCQETPTLDLNNFAMVPSSFPEYFKVSHKAMISVDEISV